MLNASLAEELLSLLTPREQAETIIGDLEEAREPGQLGFWLAVLGVAFALFFAAFNTARARTLGFLAAGFVLWSALYIGVRVLGELLGLQPWAGGFVADSSGLTTQLYLAAALVLSSFLAGLLLGFRTASNGTNASAPLAMFWAAAALVMPVFDCFSNTATWGCMLLYLFGMPAFYMLPVLAGGACARRGVLRLAQRG
ncbi:MAG TPA: hypothetical protein VFY39_09105 [Gammaproteobacteria bacterium]|nr:hypothetical protein [Gammaproteobacteria bacterium]